MLTSFSGIDSSGKSTQIDLLLKYCKSHKISAKRVWAKVRGTPGIRLLKWLFRKDKGFDIDKKVEYRKKVLGNSKLSKMIIWLSMLDYAIFVAVVYRFMTIFYRIVICDRYIWDSYIELKSEYAEFDIDHSAMWKLIKWLAPKPKHSFLLYLSPQESLKRDINKSDPIIDELSVKITKYNYYMTMRNHSIWNHCIDGAQEISTIHSFIIEVLKLEN